MFFLIDVLNTVLLVEGSRAVRLLKAGVVQKRVKFIGTLDSLSSPFTFRTLSVQPRVSQSSRLRSAGSLISPQPLTRKISKDAQDGS